MTVLNTSSNASVNQTQSINDDWIASEIQKTIDDVILIYAKPNSINQRLAFVSAIFRELNLDGIKIEQSFMGTSMNYLSESFQILFMLEHKNSDAKTLDRMILDKKISINKKSSDIENNDSQELDLKIMPILNQKDKLLEMYKEINNVVNNVDASINLTAVMAIECEVLSEKKIKEVLFHNEMYSYVNPFDKWIAVMHIEAKFEKNHFANSSFSIN